MTAIVRTCWEICLLKRGPQVFPHSDLLLAVMLFIYALTDVVAALAQGLYDWRALTEAVIDTVMLAAFCILALSMRRMTARFNQTLVALLGTGALLTWFNLPFLPLADLQKIPVLQWLASLVLICIFFWSIAVMAHILCHALRVPYYLALLLAAPYQIFNLLFLDWLFPVS